MKPQAKLIRDKRDGLYTLFARNYFWQKWEPLLDNNGQVIRFKTFKEFGEITRIESFDEITITF